MRQLLRLCGARSIACTRGPLVVARRLPQAQKVPLTHAPCCPAPAQTLPGVLMMLQLPLGTVGVAWQGILVSSEGVKSVASLVMFVMGRAPVMDSGLLTKRLTSQLLVAFAVAVSVGLWSR